MTALFDCGCVPDGSDRCREHLRWTCHDPAGFSKFTEGECPPCRIARFRSVSLSSKATPTRGTR